MLCICLGEEGGDGGTYICMIVSLFVLNIEFDIVYHICVMGWRDTHLMYLFGLMAIDFIFSNIHDNDLFN